MSEKVTDGFDGWQIIIFILFASLVGKCSTASEIFTRRKCNLDGREEPWKAVG